MEKIVIVGLGQVFQRYKDIIKKNFDVVFVSDNQYSDDICSYEDMKYVPLKKIKGENECNRIIICVMDHRVYMLLKKQLVQSGIEEDRILGYGEIFIIEGMYRKELYEEDIIKFEADAKIYENKCKDEKFAINQNDMNLVFFEKNQNASAWDSFYYWTEEWIAKKILKNNPQKHYDIGGRIDGLINRLLTFDKEIVMIDIRPSTFVHPRVKTIQADATNLEEIEDNSIESISCIGLVGNIGLGRYGDPVDPDAWKRIMHTIERILKKGGKAYITITVGKERLHFNGGRTMSPCTIVDSVPNLRVSDYCFMDAMKRDGVIYEEDKALSFYDNDTDFPERQIIIEFEK